MISRAGANRHESASRRSTIRNLIASFTSFRPAAGLAAAADTLCVSVDRATSAPAAYCISCTPQVATPGILCQADLVGYSALHSLRRDYARRLQVLRELAAVGVAAPPLDDGELLALGRAVAALLPTTVRDAIGQALWHARRRNRSLRLVLEVAPEARAMLGVPWELLALPLAWGTPATPGPDDFLLLNADITLTRQVRGLGRAADRPLALPLRRQAFAAAPPDAPPIDIGAARAALGASRLAHDSAGGWYAGANTLGALHERASAHAPEIVHLLCHGEQSDTGRDTPRSSLVLHHADGRAQRVDARDLGRVLGSSPDLRLVLLQACHGGSVGLGANAAVAAESIALTLIQYGVPAVVAMQGEVGQPAANVFARACYDLLARGGAIERAVAAGRVAMRAAGSIADWSLPVLYTGTQATRRQWRA